MIVAEYEYNGYNVEVHQHPIYHDFEYVIKQNNEVKFTNDVLYKDINEAYEAVKLDIDTSENK